MRRSRMASKTDRFQIDREEVHVVFRFQIADEPAEVFTVTYGQATGLTAQPAIGGRFQT